MRYGTSGAERILHWFTGTIVGAVVAVAVAIALTTACLSFAMQDRQKAMETTAALTIVTGEYSGFGLSQVTTFFRSVAVGLSSGTAISSQQQGKSGIFDQSGKPKPTTPKASPSPTPKPPKPGSKPTPQ